MIILRHVFFNELGNLLILQLKIKVKNKQLMKISTRLDLVLTLGIPTKGTWDRYNNL